MKYIFSLSFFLIALSVSAQIDANYPTAGERRSGYGFPVTPRRGFTPPDTGMVLYTKIWRGKQAGAFWEYPSLIPGLSGGGGGAADGNGEFSAANNFDTLAVSTVVLDTSYFRKVREDMTYEIGFDEIPGGLPFLRNRWGLVFGTTDRLGIDDILGSGTGFDIPTELGISGSPNAIGSRYSVAGGIRSGFSGMFNENPIMLTDGNAGIGFITLDEGSVKVAARANIGEFIIGDPLLWPQSINKLPLANAAYWTSQDTSSLFVRVNTYRGELAGLANGGWLPLDSIYRAAAGNDDHLGAFNQTLTENRTIDLDTFTMNIDATSAPPDVWLWSWLTRSGFRHGFLVNDGPDGDLSFNTRRINGIPGNGETGFGAMISRDGGDRVTVGNLIDSLFLTGDKIFIDDLNLVRRDTNTTLLSIDETTGEIFKTAKPAGGATVDTVYLTVNLTGPDDIINPFTIAGNIPIPASLAGKQVIGAMFGAVAGPVGGVSNVQFLNPGAFGLTTWPSGAFNFEYSFAPHTLVAGNLFVEFNGGTATDPPEGITVTLIIVEP